jgi:hypothetical protein
MIHKMKNIRTATLIAALFTGPLAIHSFGALAQPAPSTATATQTQSAAPQWPRTLDFHGTRYEIYQPQIDSWTGNRIVGRMAIAIGPTTGEPTYGVADFSATTDIDKANDEVHLTQIQISRVQIPTDASKAPSIQAELSARLPAEITVRLSNLQLSYTASKQLASLKAMPVKNTAPRIFVETVPTILVLIDGSPVLRPVAQADGWQRVINSRALILKGSDGAYHLNAAGYWYTSRSLESGWRKESPSQGLLTVAATAASLAPVDPMLAKGAARPPQPPALIVSSEPAELVLLQGQAQMRPVQGTSLLSVNNADHALFMSPANNRYYLLISGRWFSSAQLNGTWTYVPSNQLGPDFARIDIHDPQAGVLASVAGTPQAKEALIATTIPQTATVSRSKANMHVDYVGGSPNFDRVPGTQLRYATNTTVPVIQVTSNEYFALYNAVWFSANSAQGPWRVATEVPASIYTIPPESPLHYVTYVQIYGSTPESVVVGYTPGYLGMLASPDGTVVYGTGYSYPPVIVDNTWVGYPPSYGYNAAIDTAAGFAFGFAVADMWGPEPYWGPYAGFPYSRGVDVNKVNFYNNWGHGSVTRTVGYNDWTGNEWRTAHTGGYNAATGSRFEGSRGADYNAYTGNAAAGQRDAYRNNTTGVAGASRSGVVENDDGQWHAGRQSVRNNANTGRTTVSGVTRTGQAGDGASSVDRRGIEHDSHTGNTVGWNNGHIYGDDNGHVYQHSEDGGWQQHTSSGWQPIQRSEFSSSNVMNDLNAQSQARDWSDQRYSAMRSDSGWGSRFGGDRFGGGGFGGGRWGGRR